MRFTFLFELLLIYTSIYNIYVNLCVCLFFCNYTNRYYGDTFFMASYANSEKRLHFEMNRSRLITLSTTLNC